eukprot:TRINITY_DN387_c0_g1_i2.p1 TRINITY_DN387_c0_g1~~TRINITY_DN387_c0_g1_i2.p1  ORF type:complete len:289 (-),score=42.18 TRINITY_DN387_c0_g1_i2:164-1030(-)
MARASTIYCQLSSFGGGSKTCNNIKPMLIDTLCDNSQRVRTKRFRLKTILQKDPLLKAVRGKETRVKGTIIPEPDFRLPITLTGIAGTLIYINNILLAAPIGLLGLLLFVQDSKRTAERLAQRKDNLNRLLRMGRSPLDKSELGRHSTFKAQERTRWYLDIGCSRHMTRSKPYYMMVVKLLLGTTTRDKLLTTRVRFVFDDEALEVKVGNELKESEENVFVGGKNRWKYSTFVNWELWWPRFPVLVYFKETQTKPEGQVHFFPVIFDGKQLYELMLERAGPSKNSSPK